MAHKVTVGGDRLGAGKKQRVTLRGFDRSTHNLDRRFRTTMAAGTLVPFFKELGKPGDTFDINLTAEVLTHPTIGPLFGSYKVQLDIFLAPWRLYNSWLHNNKLDIARNMAQVKLPQVKLSVDPQTEEPEDWDNSQINPSSLLKYGGISGVGNRASTAEGRITRNFNGIFFLAYFDLYKNYYANKQEEIGAVIHSPAEPNIETVDGIFVYYSTDPTTPLEIEQAPSTVAPFLYSGSIIDIQYTLPAAAPDPNQIMIQGDFGVKSLGELVPGMVDNGAGSVAGIYTGTNVQLTNWRYRSGADINNGRPRIATFPLANIDEIREDILTTPGNVPYIVSDFAKPPYIWIDQEVEGAFSRQSSQELLALKTYQSDLFNNWLNTEWLDGPGGVNEITAVDTSDGKFKIDALILARKVYDMLNRINISGGTYRDWQEAVHDHQPYMQIYAPMYMGGLSKELVFQEVISNSASEGQPLGQLAGRGVLSGKHKGGHVTVKVDELSYIIGIISITPRVDYSQGNDWDMALDNMDQPHKPDLDQIGFQEDITEQRAWWDTEWDATAGEWVQKSAGKLPSWVNYMTAINKTYGNFAIQPGEGNIGGGEMFMTLNRRFEKGPDGIVDLTTYIDPSKFNNIFAETQLDAQNFWVHIGINCTARRKMSAKQMPNL